MATDAIRKQAEQMAESMGVDADAIVWWLGEMRGRVLAQLGGRSEVSDGEFRDAVEAAAKRLGDLLTELYIGETFRARVARRWITTSVYYEARGEKDARQRATDETVAEFAAVDLEDEARRSLASLGL